jgi:hypothetical protein
MLKYTCIIIQAKKNSINIEYFFNRIPVNAGNFTHTRPVLTQHCNEPLGICRDWAFQLLCVASLAHSSGVMPLSAMPLPQFLSADTTWLDVHFLPMVLNSELTISFLLTLNWLTKLLGAYKFYK